MGEIWDRLAAVLEAEGLLGLNREIAQLTTDDARCALTIGLCRDACAGWPNTEEPT